MTYKDNVQQQNEVSFQDGYYEQNAMSLSVDEKKSINAMSNDTKLTLVKEKMATYFASINWFTAIVNFFIGILYLASYASMIVFLVLFGKAAPSHNYFMILFITVFSLLTFLVPCLLRFNTIRNNARNWTYLYPKQGGMNAAVQNFNLIFISLSNPHVAPFLQVIISQLAMVFAVIFSIILLRKKFRILHYICCMIVIAGGIIAHIKRMQVAGGWISILWSFFYLLGTVPIPIIQILHELVLSHKHAIEEEVDSKDKVEEIQQETGTEQESETDVLLQPTKTFPTNDADVHTEWAMVVEMAYVLVMLGILLPINYIPGSLPDGITIWEDIKQAFNCTMPWSMHSNNPGDTCNEATIFMWMLAISVNGNIFLGALVSKRISGVYAMVIASVAPLLSATIFAIPWVMGKYYESLDIFQGIGFAMVIIASFAYTFQSEIRVKNVSDYPRFTKWIANIKN